MNEKYNINKILSNWDIGKIISFKQIKKGIVNTNFIIKTSKGKFILRKQADFKKVSELKFEIKYLKYLKSKGFSYTIPCPLKTKKNSFFINTNNSVFWLYPYIKGQLVDRFNKSELKEIAKMMAEYHSLIEKAKLDNHSKASNLYQKEIIQELNSYKKQINKKLHKDKKDKIFLKKIKKLLPLLVSLDLSSYSKLPKYPLHRDINTENTIWTNEKLSGLIDFENVAEIKDAFIKDIAIMLQYSCVNKKFKYKTDINLIKFFIKEYQKYRKLSFFEISLIPIIIVMGAIEDFNYSYHLFLNDPKRASINRLNFYSKSALWHYKNKDKILNKLK